MIKIHKLLCISLLSLTSLVTGCKQDSDTNNKNDTKQTKEEVVKKYNLKFDLGYANYTLKLAEGEKVTYPERPNKNEGLMFTSWSETITTMPAKDVTITANYSNVFELGSYPQSKVDRNDESNATLIEQLESDLKVPSNETDPETSETVFKLNGWTDYGYFISNAVSSYQYYIEKEVSGQKYRGVYFTKYRPKQTSLASSTSNSRVDDEGYAANTVHWFRYDPVKWLILKGEGDKVLASTLIGLDFQDFYPLTTNRKLDADGVLHLPTEEGFDQIEGETIYPNNYKYSSIRSWLNNKFYNSCFDEAEKKRVVKTHISNDSSDDVQVMTMADYANPYLINQEGMEDYIFVPSINEVAFDPTYHLDQSYIDNTYDLRVDTISDYSKTSGAHTASTEDGFEGYYSWRLRTPLHTDASKVYFVSKSSTSTTSNTWLDSMFNSEAINFVDTLVKPYAYITL